MDLPKIKTPCIIIPENRVDNYAREKMEEGGKVPDDQSNVGDLHRSEKGSKFIPQKITKDESHNVISGKVEARNGDVIQASASYLRGSEGSGSMAEDSRQVKDQDQLKVGVEIEKEHKDLYERLKKLLAQQGVEMPLSENQFFTDIATAHLKEDKDYYKLLLKYVEHKNKKSNGGVAGNSLLAPNGKPSNLTPEQYKLVRTPAFNKWFGDWENDTKNASKVLDENGEPLLVYHGTTKEFYQFEFKNKNGTRGDWGKIGFFFTPDYDLAVDFTRYKWSKGSDSGQKKGALVLSCFVCIKKPRMITARQFSMMHDDITPEYIKEQHDSSDGWIIDKFSLEDKESWIRLWGNSGIKEFLSNQYVAFNPTQIKLADGSNTTFDSSNPDIRFDDGGKVDSDRVGGAASRFRPYETIVFDPPIIGANGAQLLSYKWAYEWTMLPNWEGELVSKRISDWESAQASADTGKDIVHQFTVKMPNGEINTVSSESVMVLLGYADRTAIKSFPSLVNAMKTLAKQKMQLAIWEEQKKEYDELINKFEKAQKPEIILATLDEIPVIARWRFEKEEIPTTTYFTMGDVTFPQDNKHFYDEKLGKAIYIPETIPSRRTIEYLTSDWVSKRVKESGGINPSGLYDLKKRVARQERKVKELTEQASQEAKKMEEGGELTSERFELNKPSNTKELEDNISKILFQYSSRKAAELKALDYLNEEPELGKQLLREKNINSRDEFFAFCNNLQAKVRKGKGKERSDVLKSIKEEKSNFHLNAILKMAHEQGAEMDRRIAEMDEGENKYDDGGEIKLGDVITAKGWSYSMVIKCTVGNRVEKFDKLIPDQYYVYPIHRKFLDTYEYQVMKFIGYEERKRSMHAAAYSKSEKPVLIAVFKSDDSPNKSDYSIPKYQFKDFEIYECDIISSEKETEEKLASGGKIKNENIQTGVPITIDFIKNPEKAPQLGSVYGQDVEPTGFYFLMNMGFIPRGHKHGKIKLNSPLVIDINDDNQIKYKYELSKKYGGKKGKALTAAIMKDGYDGIITKYPEGDTSELIAFDSKNAIIEMFENGGAVLLDEKKLLAPNGKSSNLTPEEYNLVRTPEFKKWFGDWENDPANSSKVVDGNGEPLVVYRSQENERGVSIDRASNLKGMYFSQDRESTKKYGDITRKYFLDLKNPKMPEIWNMSILEQFHYNKLISEKFDGAIWNRNNVMYEIIALRPEQIMPIVEGSQKKESGGAVLLEEEVLLAPNGMQSNLPPIQYKLVRTDAFKNWFGDWENDPSNASKVVDGNGEPLIVYHGTPKIFHEFDMKKIGSTTGNFGHYGYGAYFSEDLREAKGYGENIITAFLKIKNPFLNENDFFDKLKEQGILDIDDKIALSIDFGSLYNSVLEIDKPAALLLDLMNKNGYEKGWQLFMEENKTSDSKFDLNEISDVFQHTKTSDGVPDYIVDYLNDNKIVVKYNMGYLHDQSLHWITDLGNRAKEVTEAMIKIGYDGVIVGSENVPFYPEQIKLADGTNTTFNINNPDMRFEKGGDVEEFDYESLFNVESSDKRTQQEIEKSQHDQYLKDKYLESRFSKKWAATFEEAKEKLLADYFSAKETFEDWSSRSYKKNKGTVFVGEELGGTSKSIGSINESRKQRNIRAAKMQMEESISDLYELGLSESEVNEEINKIMASGGAINNLELKSAPDTEKHLKNAYRDYVKVNVPSAVIQKEGDRIGKEAQKKWKNSAEYKKLYKAYEKDYDGETAKNPDLKIDWDGLDHLWKAKYGYIDAAEKKNKYPTGDPDELKIYVRAGLPRMKRGKVVSSVGSYFNQDVNEIGVSVFPAHYYGKSGWILVDTGATNRLTMDYDEASASKRPLYLVEGVEIGVGHDDEPLLDPKTLKVIGLIDGDKVVNDKNSYIGETYSGKELKKHPITKDDEFKDGGEVVVDMFEKINEETEEVDLYGEDYQRIRADFIYKNKKVGNVLYDVFENKVFLQSINSFKKGFGKSIVNYIVSKYKGKKMEGDATPNSMGFWKKMGAEFDYENTKENYDDDTGDLTPFVMKFKKGGETVSENENEIDPAYLMTLTEYQQKVTPMIKEYQSFIKKNAQYLRPTGYLRATTWKDIVEKENERFYGAPSPDPNDMDKWYKTLDKKTKEKIYSEHIEKKEYEWAHVAGKEVSKEPVPSEILARYKIFNDFFVSVFGVKVMVADYAHVERDELKSNKRSVRRAIDDDIYKNLLKENKVTFEKIKQVADSVGVSIPKKVTEGYRPVGDYEQKISELFKDIPSINREILKGLISEINDSFAELSKHIYQIENDRAVSNIEYIQEMKDIAAPEFERRVTYDKVFEHLKKIIRVEKLSVKDRFGNPDTIEYYAIPSLNPNWKENLDKGIRDYIEDLKAPLFRSVIQNFERINMPISKVEKKYLKVGAKGMEGIYHFDFENGSSFDLESRAVAAGGHTIQRFHYRYISDFINVKLKDGKGMSSASLYQIVENFSNKKELLKSNDPYVAVENSNTTSEVIDSLYNYLKKAPGFSNVRKSPKSISYTTPDGKSRGTYFGAPPSGKLLMDLAQAKKSAAETLKYYVGVEKN